MGKTVWSECNEKSINHFKMGSILTVEDSKPGQSYTSTNDDNIDAVCAMTAVLTV